MTAVRVPSVPTPAVCAQVKPVPSLHTLALVMHQAPLTGSVSLTHPTSMTLWVTSLLAGGQQSAASRRRWSEHSWPVRTQGYHGRPLVASCLHCPVLPHVRVMIVQPGIVQGKKWSGVAGVLAPCPVHRCLRGRMYAERVTHCGLTRLSVASRMYAGWTVWMPCGRYLCQKICVPCGELAATSCGVLAAPSPQITALSVARTSVLMRV